MVECIRKSSVNERIELSAYIVIPLFIACMLYNQYSHNIWLAAWILGAILSGIWSVVKIFSSKADFLYLGLNFQRKFLVINIVLIALLAMIDNENSHVMMLYVVIIYAYFNDIRMDRTMKYGKGGYKTRL